MSSASSPPIAVLSSGGLDSALLISDLARSRPVYPIYIQAGLRWEQEEQRALAAFLHALAAPAVRPVTSLTIPAAPLYGAHWSLSGDGIPGASAANDAVFLPGRNVLLLAAAAVWGSVHGVHELAIGSLEGNPFPDGNDAFFATYQGVLAMALSCPIRISAPYRGRRKEELIREFQALPLDLTLTCMQPLSGVHCGACNKCQERRDGFARAGVADRTSYAR
jgi:7-cyano-7-deazaguanine synthase